VVEAAGWLMEGVFCGFFDSREADIVWARFRPLVMRVWFPSIVSDRLVSDRLRNQVSSLLMLSGNPFPETFQMTEGPQRAFELPLFSQALLLADRLDSDAIANGCIEALYTFTDEEWSGWKISWPSINGVDVVRRLTEPLKTSQDNASLLAGYLSLLEHMDASRMFFQYAKMKSARQIDFDSYCQRIGDLNGWRVPLADFRGARERFDELAELLEFAVRRDSKEAVPDAPWSDFQAPFQRHVRSLVATWETYHLAAFLVGA
jgi:hypothetical protein